jgi:hypothetical protein
VSLELEYTHMLPGMEVFMVHRPALMPLRFFSLLSIPLYVCNPYITSHLFDAIATITTLVIYI